MEELDDSEDYGVGFLYKAMRERDPKKRRVKPVDKHLLQLDFGGLEDSSDDSDYEVADYQDGNSEPDSEEEESSGTSDSSEGSLRSDEEEEQTNGRSESEEMTVEDLIANLKGKSSKAEEFNMSNVSSSAKLRVRICSVCLGDYSEEDDEIVECDSCGITVHEGCYGVSENQSVGSTVSSASTEPWFCDACKAGVKPHCELCPNFGGIYKETDAGKWVHVVCALYIPGVAFGDVDLLSPVTLLEMPYSKWGARECDLCEDARFSRTGVSIGCDAGMCRNYFHVTCAQREGLLSEASPEEDIADPFFAYCKQHAERNGARMKRRNFLAVQSNCKKPDEKTEGDYIDDKEKVRVERKLKGHRQKYLITRTNRAPTWVACGESISVPLRTQIYLSKMPNEFRSPMDLFLVPSEKLPRLLTTSPSAMRRLLRKAELLGISTQVSANQKTDIRKKWHVAPAFSVDFISYYLDRNVRIKNGKSHLRDHLQQKDKLDKQERVLRAKYDRLHGEVEKQNKRNNLLRSEAEKLWEMLGKLNGKPFPTPKVLRPKKLAKRKKDTPKSTPAVIHSCGICNRSHNQHLLAHCDTCKKYYHLGCVDPPLTRMPKKTKLMGWQCSECDSSESGDSDTNEDVDTNAPRKLRESHQIKLPAKFTPPPKDSKKESGVAKDRKGKRKRKKSKKLLQAEGEEEEKEMPVLKKERPLKVGEPKPPKPRDVRTQCCVCLQTGDNNNLVRCDECKLCYHFGCLDPPLKKSPKQRGYAWHCTACDPTESDDNDDDEEENEGETLEMEEEEDPLEPPKLEKVAKEDESTRSEKDTPSTSKLTALPDTRKTKSTSTTSSSTVLESVASTSPVKTSIPSATKSVAQSIKESSIVTNAAKDGEVTPVTTKKKTGARDKPQEKRLVAVTETPVSKSKNFSHDATVLHVAQDSSNCSPLTAFKPIASSTPDLCYAGTEDIVPKNGTKSAKNKKKTCSKKENKSALKHKPDNIDLSVKKKPKTTGKKLHNKSENVNGSIEVQMESKICSIEPVKKKKRTKKTKTGVENGDESTTVKSEINGIQKKKIKKNKKLTENVKDESLKMSADKDVEEKVKNVGTKKKRKVDIDSNDTKADDCSKAKKKKKSDKKNSAQGKGLATKKKKEVKTEPLDNSSDLNASVENQDEDSLDLSSVLMNKKPTAEALALQATVEKLQGRLTPTLYQGSSNNGNTNGSNIESLQAILPKLVSSRPDNCKQANELEDSGVTSKPRDVQTSDQAAEIGSSHRNDNEEPSKSFSPNVPLNLSNFKETAKATSVSVDKSVVSKSKPVIHKDSGSSPQSNVLDLSNKGDTSFTVISNDVSIDLSRKDQSLNFQPDKDKSVHQTPTKPDMLVKPIAHVNNFDKISKKAGKCDSVANEVINLQNKHGKGAQNEDQDENVVRPQSHSKAVKKERVESAIARLFQKRDNMTGSSGIKKQRVEKTIDMLLAKKERSVEQMEKEKGVAENLHQKSIKDSDNTKDNRS